MPGRGDWTRPDLSQDIIDREAKLISELVNGPRKGDKPTTMQPIAVRILKSLVHEFEEAGVDMIPVSHLRTVIERIEQRMREGGQ